MTIDVTIGKIRDDGYVSECPVLFFDLTSNPRYSRRSYRSGSGGNGLGSFSEFLTRINLREDEMCNHINDTYSRLLTPSDAALVSSLDYEAFPDPEDRDRLKWVKFWVSEAIRLYGKKAAIEWNF